jgi:hypothetical protein
MGRDDEEITRLEACGEILLFGEKNHHKKTEF